MDEFDIYLESTGSMSIYKDSTMSVFRNHFTHPILLEGDWRVALADIIFPSSIKNKTTKAVKEINEVAEKASSCLWLRRSEKPMGAK